MGKIVQLCKLGLWQIHGFQNQLTLNDPFVIGQLLLQFPSAILSNLNPFPQVSQLTSALRSLYMHWHLSEKPICYVSTFPLAFCVFKVVYFDTNPSLLYSSLRRWERFPSFHQQSLCSVLLLFASPVSLLPTKKLKIAFLELSSPFLSPCGWVNIDPTPTPVPEMQTTCEKWKKVRMSRWERMNVLTTFCWVLEAAMPGVFSDI